MAEEKQNGEGNREDLLLRSLADQHNEFERFRGNVSERLTRLERRRSVSLSSIDPYQLAMWVCLAVALVQLVRQGLEIYARMRKEKSYGNVSLPEA